MTLFLPVKPKYMKKIVVEESWVQPIATLNVNLDKDEFSVTGCSNTYPNGYCFNEWKTLLLPPFNGGTSAIYQHTNGANPNVGWIFRIPSGVRLQSLDFSLDTGVILYGSYDKATWISLVNISGAGQKHIDLNNTDYTYYKMVSNPSISVGYNDGNGIKHYATLSNVIITATIKPGIAIESTKDDYDYIEHKPFTIVKPKYMKKTIVETPFVQPILSAKGTLGGSGFAVSVSSEADAANYPGWAIFDNNTTFLGHTWLGANNTQNQWVIFYNPIPIKITNLNIVNATGQNRHIASGNVYFSDDGVTWTLHKAFTNSNYTQGSNWNISITEAIGHKYWKLGELNYASGSSGVGIAEMYITATTQTISAIESTVDDYNYIEHRNFAVKRGA